MKRIVILAVMLALVAVAFAEAETVKAPSFEDFGNIEWTFSSGVGGWFTTMRIQPDGTFAGQYHDSEMGEMGDDYPNGTVYGCLFHGKLSMGEQVDDNAWKVHVDSVELDEGQAPEAIEDGIRYVTCDPYGVVAGHDMTLYLPGTPVSALPEGFQFWAFAANGKRDVEALPYYGLYDEEADTGFIGEEAISFDAQILGAWRSVEDEGAERYELLTLNGDGTGSLMNMPEDMGVALAWYAADGGWTVCLGGPDETAGLSYDADTNRLSIRYVDGAGNETVTEYVREKD